MKPLLLFAMAAAVAACGSEPAVSAEPGAGTSEAIEGWTVLVEGAGDGIDLPPIDGNHFSVSRLGPEYVMNGIDDAGRLMAKISPEGDLTVGEAYPHRMFSIKWSNDQTTCAGGAGLTVTVHDLDPISGSYSGPGICWPDARPSERFDVTLSGEFGETM